MIKSIKPATCAFFAEIATWRYDPPYDFYNGDPEPVLNPERFFEVLDSNERVVGFFYFEQRDDALEYGLGLRPDLTGKGLGLDFFRSGLEFGRDRYRPLASSRTWPSSMRVLARSMNEPASMSPDGT